MIEMKDILNIGLKKGKGIFRLSPNWVPRSFCVPGRRLKLHPDDYYAFGTHRGGIDERWFASTTKADNGPLTLEDEGLSYIYIEEGAKKEKILLKDAIEKMGDEILGNRVMNKYGGWTIYAKFFDNMEPLPLHLHQNDEKAADVGRKGKPEGYYFPKQLNNHPAYFPHTYFGLNPGTNRDNIKKCLENWDKGDNGILYYSKAYKLKPGTGWDVPPGVLHAPGTLLTYEPQFASDVFAMFQNLAWDKYIPWELLVKDVPEGYKRDLDYIVDLINWDLNLDPNFFKNRFLEPKPVKPLEDMKEQGYEEYLVVYNSDFYSAKELTVYPNQTIIIKEKGAYGLIVIQGHGKFGELAIESPAMIRFGQMTQDELFITHNIAKEGIEIKNESKYDNLVMLKHIGPVA
jgi:mannose-6-phosphate isomerase class I